MSDRLQPMEDLENTTLRGFQWSLLGRIGRVAAHFLTGIVLIRLLEPSDFGLIAMITVVVNFVLMLICLEVEAGLIQLKEVAERHLSTVFWFSLGVGLVTTSVFALGSGVLAGFYGEPDLIEPARFLSLLFLIQTLQIVPRALASRALAFKRLAVVDTVATLVAAVGSISLALTGFGIWSLVADLLITQALVALLFWATCSWRPQAVFAAGALSELRAFSLPLWGTRLSNYWERNIDDLLIGRQLGDVALGVYNRAYAIMLFPLTNLSQTFSKVLFPSFSVIRDDPERIRSLYLRATRLVAVLVFPVCAGLIATAESLVTVLFGAQWLGMAPILELFALSSAIQSILHFNGPLYLATGRTGLQLKVGTVLKLHVILWIVIAVPFGVTAVAFCYTLAVVLNAYPGFRFAGSVVSLRFHDLAQNLIPVSMCAIAMGVVVSWAGRLVPEGSALMDLAIRVPLGVLCYGALLHLTRNRAWKEFREFVGAHSASGA